MNSAQRAAQRGAAASNARSSIALRVSLCAMLIALDMRAFLSASRFDSTCTEASSPLRTPPSTRISSGSALPPRLSSSPMLRSARSRPSRSEKEKRCTHSRGADAGKRAHVAARLGAGRMAAQHSGVARRACASQSRAIAMSPPHRALTSSRSSCPVPLAFVFSASPRCACRRRPSSPRVCPTACPR